jgi:hypothetical protein
LLIKKGHLYYYDDDLILVGLELTKRKILFKGKEKLFKSLKNKHLLHFSGK